ncbi:MAG TPA: ABC transporter ATP-binding protein [Rhodospirillales bacterium]|nr:ABC transporter ATP-binding protein [Rhodospirillales bacterium]
MLLEINDINKSFGGLLALQDISFSVEEGETLGIMGANGAGKTTLFSLIAGHAKPSRGKITLAGRQIDGMRPDQISALGIARTYQIVRPFRGLTVLENVAAGALYGSRQEKTMNSANDFAMEILSDVGLDDRANDLAGNLTLAGFKRLELAKALATGPKILLLDEVMAGLTPSEVNEAIAIIEASKQKFSLTVIVIEHVMKALMRMCERIVVLHHGEMIAMGAPDQIAKDELVIQAYLGEEK